MRSRHTQKRGRRAWRAAGGLLLGLMGGATGCQWTHDHLLLRPPATNTATTTTVSQAASGPAARSQEVVQTSAAAPSPSDLILASAGGQAEEVPQGAQAQPAVAEAAAQREDDKPSIRIGKRPTLTGGEVSYEVDRTLPAPSNGIATPAIPMPEKALPITLGASLALAGVENPVIAIAQQAIRVARADQLRAQVLLLPSLNVGSSYDLHNGPLQGSPGEIRKVDRQAVYYGLGAYSVVAGSVNIPGLWIFEPLADAVYEPLIARQVVANRRFAATATRNQILLDVATAYLDLLGAEGRLAVIRQSEKDFQEVANLTAKFAKPGVVVGREADANRAAADLQQLQFEEQRVQEDVAVAAADLARLLNLDPSTRLHTGDVPIQVVQFVDPKDPLPKLLEIAARNRPELMAAAATIRASQTRLTQEKTRPLWPTLWAGFSAGDFGGGAVAIQNPVGVPPSGLTDGVGQPGGHTTPVFGKITGRTDVDVIAFWTLENFGLGNIAHVKQRRAQLNQAQAARQGVFNLVERQVTEAYSLAAQNFQSIAIERKRVQVASEGFQEDLKRVIDGVGLPIEVLNNAERLVAARQALLAAVIGFDRAQFQLFVAMGQPPTMVVEEDKLPEMPPPAAELPPPNAVQEKK
jgi:outer membrane protein TolC